MIKVFRFVAMCTISVAFATSSIASAQVYTTIDFPGATATTLNGGPNPEGTSVGSYTASGVIHGFTLTKKGVFTSFDPPVSTFTSPGFISPQGVIVGGYNDASSVSHGFVLSGGHYTTVDYPGAAEPFSVVSTPQVKCQDHTVPTLPAAVLVARTRNTVLQCPRPASSPASIHPAQSAARPATLIPPARSWVLTILQWREHVLTFVKDTCCTTGHSPRLIFRALSLRLLERITRRATS